jgi:hypothetical protein
LNQSEADGIGTVLGPSGKKAHQREIGAGPGVNFHSFPPGRGRNPAQPE